ncbi:putative nucleoredoxin 2 [Bidens hawaiensis]|uniref:putative nucleoredoxin 2 n=1 Tax=Bidens hawaiensis TaxID=980011 RepID=UPI00404AFE6A
MTQQLSSMNTTSEQQTTTAVNRHKYLSLFATDHRDYLLSPTGAQIKISELEDKTVGIYFSANWYPQCQTFTKLLIQVYNQIQAKKESNFEIIFVSSDEDLNAFNNFYQSYMPWLAIPFSDLETKKALNKRFDVEGIPCLIILQPHDDDDASVLHDGVELIYRYGVDVYPFTNARLDELLRQEREKHERQTLANLLTNHDRDFVLAPSSNKVSLSSLMGKTIGLYFSAQWCLPSHKFTPKLISIYQKIKQNITQQEFSEEQEDFEIIYVSSDQNELEFNTSFSVMPWLALPFGDPTSKNLTKYFDIRGIPTLIILGPDGKTVTKNGRSLINLYEEEAYPFTEARVKLLEKQMDEDAKILPSVELHSGHRHELMLVSQGNGGGPFICCDCDEQGLGWAYQCIDCGYEVHTKCIRPVVPVSSA